MQKKVQFNNHVQIISIPLEERKGIWMQYAIDRAHFKRKIEHAETLLSAILRSKLNDIKKMCEVNLGTSETAEDLNNVKF
jgi:hypothetical protein